MGWVVRVSQDLVFEFSPSLLVHANLAGIAVAEGGHAVDSGPFTKRRHHVAWPVLLLSVLLLLLVTKAGFGVVQRTGSGGAGGGAGKR